MSLNYKTFSFLFLLFCQISWADTNLALFKTYTISPKPDYYLCTDMYDNIQLTDGKKFGSFWRIKSTVGWNRPKTYPEVVLDLGKKAAIYEVQIYTVGGGLAYVDFPMYLAVLLSDDGQFYKFGGVASSKGLEKDKKPGRKGLAATISIKHINAQARFVKLILKPGFKHLFFDEIEVWGDSLESANNKELRKNLYTVTSSGEVFLKIDNYFALKDTCSETIKAVRNNATKFSSNFHDTVLSELNHINTKLDDLKYEIYAINELIYIKKSLGQLRAQIYKEIYKKPYVCILANPMEILFEKEMHFSDTAVQLDVKLWQNEYESAAFNIINCSEEEIAFSVSVSPITTSDGKILNSESTISIKRAVFAKAKVFGSIADAIVTQKDRSFILQPGELSQVWLTVFNPILEEGEYKGKIAVLAQPAHGKTLPINTFDINLTVGKNDIPDDIALNSVNWAFRRVGTSTETAEDLYSHHTNVYVIDPSDTPFPGISADPFGTNWKPDLDKLGKIIRQHNYAKTYLLFLNFNARNRSKDPFGGYMTPRWKAVFSSWLKDTVAFLKESQIGYDRFALYPFDENLSDEFYELALFVKQIDPQIKLFANSVGKGPRQIKRFRNLIDIWCPHNRDYKYYPKWTQLIKSFGKPVWTYDTRGSGKDNAPYDYYRLLAWRAFSRGQSGIGFWCYYSANNYENVAAPWDDSFAPYGYYSVIYGAKTSPEEILDKSIVTSRRWEAWREGIEDYQYLYELQQAVDRLKEEGSSLAAKEQSLLNLQVDRVLARPNDKSVVYDARNILTKAIERLSVNNN